MKRIRISALASALVLILSLSAAASAVTVKGRIYDETDQLITGELARLGEEVMPGIADSFGFDVRLDFYTSLGDGTTLESAAEYVYENYDYGCGDRHSGVSLTLLLQPQADGWSLARGDWYLCFGGSGTDSGEAEAYLTRSLEQYLTEEAWSGDLDSDRQTAAELAATLCSSVQRWLTGSTDLPALSLPEDEYGFVTDTARLLSPQELLMLDTYACQISREYDCGVYLRIVPDHTDFEPDIFDAVCSIYHSENLGLGQDRSGILLLLSMDGRSAGYFVCGEWAEYALGTYAREEMVSSVRGWLLASDWDRGCLAYLQYCEEAFACARAGDPIEENFAYAYFLATAGALILALLWVRWDTRSSFSVSQQKKAITYEVRGSFRLEQHSDMFLNEEVTVKKTDNKSAGSDHESRSGEGGSGGTFGF